MNRKVIVDCTNYINKRFMDVNNEAGCGKKDINNLIPTEENKMLISAYL